MYKTLNVNTIFLWVLLNPLEIVFKQRKSY